MNGIIINPNGLDSVIASSSIAKFLSNKFKIKVYGKINYQEVYKKNSFDWIFLMNSGFGCVTDKQFGEWIADTVKKSNRAIFVCNDYKLLYPCGYTRFIDPKKYTYWTTIPEYNGRLCKKLIYVNWNKLTYNPLPLRKEFKFDKCIYWGAYRKSRIEFFEGYLNFSKVTISTSKRAQKGFEVSCPIAKIIPNFKYLYQTIRNYACTIYLEDETRKYCSPANRFYEALSAGIPMFFQAESISHMSKAGYDVRKYVVKDGKDLISKIGKAEEIAKEQIKWRRDYVSELHKEVENAVRETK